MFWDKRVSFPGLIYQSFEIVIEGSFLEPLPFMIRWVASREKWDGCGSAVEHLLCIWKVPGSVPVTSSSEGEVICDVKYQCSDWSAVVVLKFCNTDICIFMVVAFSFPSSLPYTTLNALLGRKFGIENVHFVLTA